MAFVGGTSYSSFSYGQWLSPTQHRYLGLKFTAGGNVHYGWARFNVTLVNPSPIGYGFHVTLTGYAYETIPNKPIITGQNQGAGRHHAGTSQPWLLGARRIRDSGLAEERRQLKTCCALITSARRGWPTFTL